jgi:predicted GNAT family N-acyltransferase
MSLKMFLIKPVETEEEFEAYFNLRWRLLRKPWHQAKGSEQDDIEDQCYHCIAVNRERNVIGVARLQFNTNNTAQVRYMAVDTNHQNQGIGRALMTQLEAQTIDHQCNIITLDARDTATSFYSKLGYSIEAKSYLLFDEIQHYRMSKSLHKSHIA